MSLLRKLFTEMLQMLWWQKVKLCTYTVGFSCTTFEVLPCAILFSRTLMIILTLYLLHIVEHVFSEKEVFHDVSPDSANNTTCLSLSFRAVDIWV